MPLIGALIKQGLKFSTRVIRRDGQPGRYQRRELRRLLRKAAETQFGIHFGFDDILGSDDYVKAFQDRVPVYDYNSIFKDWWHRCLSGEEDVCWPGQVKYFALSSGTSESSSKHIPVTAAMIRALRRASIRQITTLGNYDIPSSVFEKGILWLGGSTELKKQGGYFEGDVSGISARRVPIWFQKYYKPGKKISRETDWNVKLDEITRQADKWDIGIITGVPSWVQLLLEKIIDHYKLKSIHDLWPDLSVYAHGGVSFEPYRNSFAKFFSKPVHYIEMYPASEGFIAFQSEPGARYMKLICDNRIFYEFIPFDEKHFDDAGNLRAEAKALTIDQVESGKDYALLMSTCAGAWRYLIGDVIRFTDTENADIIITGRTKHFLSLAGEHLSVDNMNKAVAHLAEKIKTGIPEFTVVGLKDGNSFYHQWYIGTESEIGHDGLAVMIDEKLHELNDDYAVERKSALKDVRIKVIPVSRFYDYMKKSGRMGGQNKFPRVMKESQHADWVKFLESDVTE